MREQDVRAQRLRGLMKRLVRAIRLLERGDAACCGVTLSQCHALGEVAAREGLTSGELASRLGIDPSAVTRLTDALAQQGLVRRETDPSDRRVVRLALTTAGQQLWSRIQNAMLDRSRAILERFPPAQQEAILEACEHLVRVLEQEGYFPSSLDQGGSCHGQERTAKDDPRPVR